MKRTKRVIFLKRTKNVLTIQATPQSIYHWNCCFLLKILLRKSKDEKNKIFKHIKTQKRTACKQESEAFPSKITHQELNSMNPSHKSKKITTKFKRYTTRTRENRGEKTIPLLAILVFLVSTKEVREESEIMLWQNYINMAFSIYAMTKIT